MGKRCRLAALGATFALLVAACAASEQPSERSSAPTGPPASLPSTDVPSPITFPESLANASFVQAEPSDPDCQAGNASQLALIGSTTGVLEWAFPIPRPGDSAVVDGTNAFFSFRWDGDQHPGIGAVDLSGQVPLWQRFLSTEVEAMADADESLIVVTNDDVRAIDKATGDDLWVNDPQFDFIDVAIGDGLVFTLDSVGLHAIDFATGSQLWQLAIDRPDTVRVNGNTVAVTSGTRLVGVDITQRSRLFDIEVTRLGASELWVFDNTVAYELAPSVAPGGGVAVLDRNSGFELWRATSTGQPIWMDGGQLITSTANTETAPSPRFVLLAHDALTGDELWRTPSTAQSFDAVIGTGDQRLVAVDPHPAVPEAQRVRLLNGETGEALWTQASVRTLDSAVIEPTATTLFGSATTVGVMRGTVARTNGTTMSWTAQLEDGIAQPPISTTLGTLILSGERHAICVSRSIGEPTNPSS